MKEANHHRNIFDNKTNADIHNRLFSIDIVHTSEAFAETSDKIKNDDSEHKKEAENDIEEDKEIHTMAARCH